MPIKKIDPTSLHTGDVVDNLVTAVNENLDAVVEALQNVKGGGVIGPQGEKGEQGLPGRDGTNGRDGIDGKDGLPGKDGAPGAKGDTGEQGIQGVPGAKGETGTQGLQGLRGEQGLPGVPGAQGPQGVAGPAGKDGVNGTNGKDGVGITNAVVTNGNLIITKSDGTTVDAGRVLANVTANTATTTTTSGPPVVGGAVNPMYSPIATTTTMKGYIAAYCNAGVFLTLDNLKFAVTTSGARGICCATVAGTNTLSINAYYSLAGGASGYATNWPGAVTTTTPSGSWFGWSFPNAGDGATYIVNDNTNQKVYRVTMQIGPGYAGNFISIERLL